MSLGIVLLCVLALNYQVITKTAAEDLISNLKGNYTQVHFEELTIFSTERNRVDFAAIFRKTMFPQR